MFHKVKKVLPQKNYILQVTFVDGTEKEYDVKPLIEDIPEFNDLKTIPNLFEQVQVDVGGYGISWTEYIDLSSEDIWVSGKTLIL